MAAKTTQSLTPQEPLLQSLIEICRENPATILLKQHSPYLEITALHFLNHILFIRDEILFTLSVQIKDNLQATGTDVVVLVFVDTQYEEIVTFMALYSIGATFAAMEPHTSMAEAEYFTKIYNAAIILGGTNDYNLTTELGGRMNIPIVLPTLSPHNIPIIPLSALDLSFYSIDPEKGVAIYSTSGTTGRPKGALFTRAATQYKSPILTKLFRLSSKEKTLIRNPIGWGWALWSFIAFLHHRVSMELCNSVFTPVFFWEKIKLGEIRIILFAPSDLVEIQEWYEENIMVLGEKEKQVYLLGLEKVSFIATGGGYINQNSWTFWRQLGGGNKLVNMYGSTEGGPLASSRLLEDNEELKLFCVGEKLPYVEVNLKEGDEGELYIKSPGMFKRYLISPEQLLADPKLGNPFDRDGFFHTGDIARLEGNQLFILGRISTDMIHASNQKVYAPAVENTLLSLPDTIEAIVLGIPSDEDGQERVAALLKFVPGSPMDMLNTNILEALQIKLVGEKGLALFMVPTVLRILKHEEVVVRNKNHKVNKVNLRKLFFGVDLKIMREDIRWDVKDPDEQLASKYEANIPFLAWGWNRR